MGLDANLIRISGEERQEVAYFRKVNFLHQWVTLHCNGGVETNCEDVPMNLEQIAGLAQACDKVLANPTKGHVELPTTTGFFFGSVEYDEAYLRDISEVLEACQRIIALEVEANSHGLPPARICYWSWW